jgi:hypothetical protein
LDASSLDAFGPGHRQCRGGTFAEMARPALRAECCDRHRRRLDARRSQQTTYQVTVTKGYAIGFGPEPWRHSLCSRAYTHSTLQALLPTEILTGDTSPMQDSVLV